MIMEMNFFAFCMTIFIYTQCSIHAALAWKPSYYVQKTDSEILDITIAYNLENEKITKEIYQWGNSKNFLLKYNGIYIAPNERTPLQCSPANEECKWLKSSGWEYYNKSVGDNYFMINAEDDTRDAFGRRLTLESNFGWMQFELTPTTKDVGVCVIYKHNEETDEVDSHRDIPVESPNTYWPRSDENRDEGEVYSNGRYYGDYQNDGENINNDNEKEGVVLLAKSLNETIFKKVRFVEHQVDEWKLRTFYLPLIENLNSSIDLRLDVSGEGITLYNVYGCNTQSDGDVSVIRMISSPPNITFNDGPSDFGSSNCYNGGRCMRQTNTCICREGFTGEKCDEVSSKCYNGGRYMWETSKCICPEGFTGEKCEEGCGPYYVGPNCSHECSNFKRGCSRMVFCKDGLPCLCAPGYGGEKCHTGCERGTYGPNCRLRCGQCVEGSDCDVYTGVCHSGCESGFYPPLCLIPYRYSPVPPRVLYRDFNTATVEAYVQETDLQGLGQVLFYQFQYKEYEMQYDFGYWIKLPPHQVETYLSSANISHLSAGMTYSVRVIYVHEDGNFYDGHLVPETQFATRCTVPQSNNYNVSYSTTSSTILMEWQYIVKQTECPITGFTVILERNQHITEYNTSSKTLHVELNDLLPGATYKVNLRANTEFGQAPTSSYSVKTRDDVPLHVSSIRVKKNGPRKLLVSWKPPRFTGGKIEEYIVKYKCVAILGCGKCSDTEEEVLYAKTTQNSIIINNLRPHTQYSFEIAAKSKHEGPYTLVHGLTQAEVPDAAPRASSNPLPFSSNSSVTVQWLQIDDCTSLNGFSVGYHYELYAENNRKLEDGNTVNTNVTFYNLHPQTTYLVYIYQISSGGWNANKKLIINATTIGTVPDKVQNLTIYKRGRRSLGLRWSEPINCYGTLESFSVSYCEIGNCASEVEVSVVPERCTSWPSQFCHTIYGLSPNKQYSVSVRARNALIEHYGEASTVNAITSEGAPEIAESLHILSRTTKSITLKWKPPRMFNGVLRSFLINIEHTDSANYSNCCTYFPIREFMVKNEEEYYVLEVSNLFPASKYNVGISAKTISIGPTTHITAITPPEMPTLTHPPQLDVFDGPSVEIISEGNFDGIVGTYLLLILSEDKQSPSVIWNAEISQQLKNVVKKNFYIIQEIDAEEMDSSTRIEIGQEVSPHNGTIGVLQDPELPSEYSVGVALVLDYNGAASVGFIAANIK